MDEFGTFFPLEFENKPTMMEQMFDAALSLQREKPGTYRRVSPIRVERLSSQFTVNGSGPTFDFWPGEPDVLRVTADVERVDF